MKLHFSGQKNFFVDLLPKAVPFAHLVEALQHITNVLSVYQKVLSRCICTSVKTVVLGQTSCSLVNEKRCLSFELAQLRTANVHQIRSLLCQFSISCSQPTFYIRDSSDMSGNPFRPGRHLHTPREATSSFEFAREIPVGIRTIAQATT